MLRFIPGPKSMNKCEGVIMGQRTAENRSGPVA